MIFNENKKDQEKRVMEYERFIAGALLKFETLDNVDFSLLVEDFKKKTNIKLIGAWYYSHNNLGAYRETLENGTIKLRDGISLDYIIEEEKCTLRDKLLAIAGNTVNNYFSSLEIETFKQEKEKSLLENKDKVLSTANILLVSDIQDDYDELVKYGFKNVDYFKSIIRADQYFTKHPEELEKYHIILKGNQNVQNCCFDRDVELDRKFGKLREEKHILVVSSLYRFDYSDHMELVTYLKDRINVRSWNIEERTYRDIFDRIVENTLINHTFENVGLKNKKFAPIQDYINPNRLPLPTKKSDLKILYLDSIMVSKYADGIASELGLNVNFKEDTNYSLGRYVKSNLGKYDIVIVSHYSRNILGMNHESTEQCKDTGKELTLFVAQDDLDWGVDIDLADGIKLEYVFGGNYAPDSEYHRKEIRILRQSIDVEAKDEYRIKYYQSRYSKIKGILEASVNFYNQALLQNGKPAINDIDFKTAEELDQDYINAYENKKAIRKAELAPIRAFDDIRYAVSSYLRYRKKGLISQLPEGLRITEGKNGIKVENIYQGKTYCSITFQKEYKQENLRIFQIQTLSKKGNLSAPETIGVYTSNYDNLESIPNRPDERQANALTSIAKKINVALCPLNDEVWDKQCELEKPKNYLKRK